MEPTTGIINMWKTNACMRMTTKPQKEQQKRSQRQETTSEKYIFKCAKRWVHHIVILGYLCAILPCTHWPYSYFLHGSAHRIHCRCSSGSSSERIYCMLHFIKNDHVDVEETKREKKMPSLSGEIERYTAPNNVIVSFVLDVVSMRPNKIY